MKKVLAIASERIDFMSLSDDDIENIIMKTRWQDHLSFMNVNKRVRSIFNSIREKYHIEQDKLICNQYNYEYTYGKSDGMYLSERASVMYKVVNSEPQGIFRFPGLYNYMSGTNKDLEDIKPVQFVGIYEALKSIHLNGVGSKTEARIAFSDLYKIDELLSNDNELNSDKEKKDFYLFTVSICRSTDECRYEIRSLISLS